MSEEEQKIEPPKKTVGKKAPRKSKEKAGPKRALSAYMFFAKSVRSKIKEEQPELSFGELTKVIASRWSAATPEEKAPFEKLAADDTERYRAEKAALAN